MQHDILTGRSESPALRALVKFDRMVRATEKNGAQQVPLASLRKALDICLDEFGVKAAELSAWDMEVL